jgi:excisionase family DNA binding protein
METPQMKDITTGGPEYVSPDELASLLGVHKETVLRWVSTGTVPYFRPSRSVIRIRLADAMAAFEAKANRGAAK